VWAADAPQYKVSPLGLEVKTGIAHTGVVGVMHACGHDSHTAILMGTARALASMREELPGTVMFIFQPAEDSRTSDCVRCWEWPWIIFRAQSPGQALRHARRRRRTARRRRPTRHSSAP